MEWTGSFRSIWVSDLHLGTRSSQADRFLDLLRNTESDYLYLVGDIVDGWALRRHWYWPQAHNDVIQKLLRKARKGTQVVYIPGNHDEFARHFIKLRLGDIQVERRRVHETADGKKLLVLHGDEFDGLVARAKWLMKLGSRGYDLALEVRSISPDRRRTVRFLSRYILGFPPSGVAQQRALSLYWSDSDTSSCLTSFSRKTPPAEYCLGDTPVAH